nr:hypothetical protein [Tanacetum cinerariifolium]
MAFEQRSSKPRLQSMTSRQLSSELDLTYAPSTITKQQPTEGELDLLFEAMYGDYFSGQPSATVENVPPAQEPQVRQTSTASTTSADNVPIPTNSSSHATNIPITSQDVDELNPNAMIDGNTFVNPFATSSLNAAETSSSQNVDPLNMHTFYQPYPYEFQWNKDHPLEQVIGEPSQPVLTRNQLRSDGDMCMYALTMDSIKKLAQQYLKEIVCRHGVPVSIISDRGEDHALVADGEAPTEFALMANIKNKYAKKAALRSLYPSMLSGGSSSNHTLAVPIRVELNMVTMGDGGLNFPDSATNISLGILVKGVNLLDPRPSLGWFLKSDLRSEFCRLDWSYSHALRSSLHTSYLNLESLHEILDGFSILLFDIVDFHWILDELVEPYPRGPYEGRVEHVTPRIRVFRKLLKLRIQGVNGSTSSHNQGAAKSSSSVGLRLFDFDFQCPPSLVPLSDTGVGITTRFFDVVGAVSARIKVPFVSTTSTVGTISRAFHIQPGLCRARQAE